VGAGLSSSSSDVVSYMAREALEGMSALRCELHGAGALEWAQAFFFSSERCELHGARGA
jgi:hypothetical protein